MVFQQYRWPFLAVMALTMASAALGIGIIAFINVQLMGAAGNPLVVLPQFLGLLALLMAVTLGSQLALTSLGHYFVYRLRGQLVKRILIPILNGWSSWVVLHCWLACRAIFAISPLLLSAYRSWFRG